MWRWWTGARGFGGERPIEASAGLALELLENRQDAALQRGLAARHPFVLGNRQLAGVIGPAAQELDLLGPRERRRRDELLGRDEHRARIQTRPLEIARAIEISHHHRLLLAPSPDSARAGPPSTAGALDRAGDHRMGLLGVAPAPDTDPLLRFEVLVMLEEVL